MRALLPFLIISLMLFSCESKDGDWDSMIWESNDVGNIKNKNNIEVPQAGDSYIFTCKNYKYFRIYAIQENGKQIGEELQFMDCQKYEDSCISVNIEKNRMDITIFPNKRNQIQKISIGVTAGDIFDSFDFEQKGGIR